MDVRLRVGCLVAFAQLLGCASDSSCPDVGGVKVRGVCTCPANTVRTDDECVSTSVPTPDAGDVRSDGGLVGAEAGFDGGSDGLGDASKPQVDATLELTDTGAPDAGFADAAASDAAASDASTGCNPTGVFAGVYVERRGSTCGAGISDFSSTLDGTLANAMSHGSDCTVVTHLSADGCRVDYNELCPLPQPEKMWREIGFIVMTSPTHYEGTAKVTVEEPGLPLDEECVSDVDIAVDKVAN